MDSVTGTPPPVTATPRPSKTPSFPSREDCWSEDATFTLIEAWGERHVHLSRGNLRQKHWEEVADVVNARHVITGNPKSRRTDVQCKNRVDTLKKKYKIEKTRVSESNGSHTSSWPFFARLDSLIGSTFPKPSPPPPHRNLPALPWNVPVAPRSATLKRPAPSAVAGDEYWLRRNFNAFAAVAEAAAAAEAEEEEEEEEESEEEEEGFRSRSSRRREREREVGYRELAMAIERFGEIYERVEETKQRQIVELEKQRMQFAKDLEFHRMQLFMETQLQIQKMKRAKRSSDPDSYF